jgi:DNA-directed RNA polymerase subunit M/transcription elongation factor TFIIS
MRLCEHQHEYMFCFSASKVMVPDSRTTTGTLQWTLGLAIHAQGCQSCGSEEKVSILSVNSYEFILEISETHPYEHVLLNKRG